MDELQSIYPTTNDANLEARARLPTPKQSTVDQSLGFSCSCTLNSEHGLLSAIHLLSAIIIPSLYSRIEVSSWPDPIPHETTTPLWSENQPSGSLKPPDVSQLARHKLTSLRKRTLPMSPSPSESPKSPSPGDFTQDGPDQLYPRTILPSRDDELLADTFSLDAAQSTSDWPNQQQLLSYPAQADLPSREDELLADLFSFESGKPTSDSPDEQQLSCHPAHAASGDHGQSPEAEPAPRILSFTLQNLLRTEKQTREPSDIFVSVERDSALTPGRSLTRP